MKPEGPSGKLGILHILTLAALQDASRALGARELSSGAEEYDNVRKLLNRMLHAGQVVSPARGLYTLPGHPCLAQYPVLDPSTAPASPVPTVPTVSNISSIPSIPTTLAAPDLANDQDTDPQAAPVPSVPNIPTTPADPDPANDQDTGSHATSVPSVSTVPNATSTPLTPTARQTRLITPDESAEAWESDPNQQPDNP